MLPNARIDQLPLGEPTPGDYLVYRDEVNGVTKRCYVDPFLLSPTDTNNFEWDSVAAADGDYDINDVVTRGGNWYQSTINNNMTVPGADPADTDWTLLTRRSNWSLWEAGLYIETTVVVLKVVGSSTYIYELIDATRPYISADFDAEVTAGDWELLGKVQIVEFDTTLVSDEITLNFLKLQRIDMVESDPIVEDKEWIFSNPIEGLLSFVRFTSSENIHQLPAGIKLAGADNAEYDSALKTWKPIIAGEYEMMITYMNAEYKIKISGPFN